MWSSGKQTEDDIYCACLSKSLCQIATPVTVGLYAPFGGRVYMLLDRITKCMREEASRVTEKEEKTVGQVTSKPVGWGFFRLLWHLFFYYPVITNRHLERKSIEFIFVHFSAWQYAGSDRLWAGLVTTVCERIRSHFGILPLSVFNVLGSKPIREREEERSLNEWIFKKTFSIILVVVFLVLIVGLLLLTVPVRTGSQDGDQKTATVFGSIATILSGSSIFMTVFQLCKSVLISQKQKIERLVNSQKFSSQMGFMNEVKKEVELVTHMVQCMEIFQKQKIRVVLQITSLELCAPDKVVGVLDAMNTLLSDRQAPFISILVVDPSIIVSCLENASSLKGMADNGYMFLNRTVTLPFCVPALGKKTKLQLLKKVVLKTEDLIDWPNRTDANRGTKTGIAESVRLLRDELSKVEEPEEEAPLYDAGRCIQETFYSLYSEVQALHEYIPDSICQMKRIVNTIPVMVHLMMLSHVPWNRQSAKAVAAWVVLCNQWPCRLSWILQCLEDEEQSGSKDGFCSCLLWDVFKENSKELFSLKAGLKNLFDLDADPEVFQKFLSRDFPFKVEESRRLIGCTVNLDFSIKHKMGLQRGINNLQNDWKETKSTRCDGDKEGHAHTETVENDGDKAKKEVGKGRDSFKKEMETSSDNSRNEVGMEGFRYREDIEQEKEMKRKNRKGGYYFRTDVVEEGNVCWREVDECILENPLKEEGECKREAHMEAEEGQEQEKGPGACNGHSAQRAI
ncbi:NTPase KAP family P-loop domain-containing protein 1 [Spea bombifrons]|uniref:NTPase KAP family P-loop domain-containing protein 1 n=1 Tax=Spea bombifrons TaxID=233779 RepID=UPI00234A7FB9|nr:NTPase KAP family P-loop domain-containing protein 1 [Spea bombifrons]